MNNNTPKLSADKQAFIRAGSNPALNSARLRRNPQSPFRLHLHLPKIQLDNLYQQESRANRVLTETKRSN